MKLDFIKEKRELVSTVLLGISAFLAVLVLIKLNSFFVTPAKAKSVVEDAVLQSKLEATDLDKYLADSKVIADELKKKNLFVPPPPKKHPVEEVWGILSNEVLIKGKWYKVGDMVGDAKIIAIEATQVRIEWDGREKVFAPIQASGPPDSGGKRPEVTDRETKPEGGAEVVVAGPERGPMPALGPMPDQSEMRMGFGSPEGRARMRERFENMSEEERQEFRERMRDRPGGRRQR